MIFSTILQIVVASIRPTERLTKLTNFLKRAFSKNQSTLTNASSKHGNHRKQETKSWSSKETVVYSRQRSENLVSNIAIRVKCSLVSFPAVFRDVTQRFPERFVTSRKTAAKKTKFSSERITKHQLRSLFKVRTLPFATSLIQNLWVICRKYNSMRSSRLWFRTRDRRGLGVKGKNPLPTGLSRLIKAKRNLPQEPQLNGKTCLDIKLELLNTPNLYPG